MIWLVSLTNFIAGAMSATLVMDTIFQVRSR